MPFEVKPEQKRNDASVLITMPRDLRRQTEQSAQAQRISLSEIGRRALRLYFAQANGNGQREGTPG